MIKKLPILTCILIGMQISAAELPVLPYEILEEIRTHADNLDVAAENILNFLQVNKKMSAEYRKNPKEFMHKTIQELALQFNVDPIVAAVYLYKNKYALEFFKSQIDTMKSNKIKSKYSYHTRKSAIILQAFENFDHSIQAIIYIEKSFPVSSLDALNVFSGDIVIKNKFGIKIETQSEALIINSTKIPLIGCKTIYVRYLIQRKKDLLLYGVCHTPTETRQLIIILDTQGNLKEMFTHYLRERLF